MRIIEAVFTRLREAPTEPVAIDRVAGMAGVARSTVYVIFGSRSGLSSRRPRARRTLGLRDLDRGKHQPDARDHRAQYRAATQMLAANRDITRPPLDGTARRGGRADEEEPETIGEPERDEAAAGRVPSRAHCVTISASKAAEHVLWLLTSFESFDSLYTDRGLSTAASSRSMIDTPDARFTLQSTL